MRALDSGTNFQEGRSRSNKRMDCLYDDRLHLVRKMERVPARYRSSREILLNAEFGALERNFYFFFLKRDLERGVERHVKCSSSFFVCSKVIRE